MEKEGEENRKRDGRCSGKWYEEGGVSEEDGKDKV